MKNNFGAEKNTETKNTETKNTKTTNTEKSFDQLTPDERKELEKETQDAFNVTEYELNETISNSKVIDSYEQHMKEIGRFKVLTEAEEKRLGEIIQNGTEAEKKAAADKLVNHNLRLAVYFAWKYYRTGIDRMDLIVAGEMGIIKAAENYDPSKSRFSTYAALWIRRFITEEINRTKDALSVPKYIHILAGKIQKAEKEYMDRTGKALPMEELAGMLNEAENKIRYAKQYLDYTYVSLNDNSKGDEGGKCREEYISNKKAEDPYTILEGKAKAETIRCGLEKLSPKERKIICLRYGIGCLHVYSLREISEMPDIKLSKERVRQIEVQALAKLGRMNEIKRWNDNYR